MTSKRTQLKARQAEAQARAKRNHRIIVGAVSVVLSVLVGVIAWVLVNSPTKPVDVTQITPPNAMANSEGITVKLGTPKAGAPVVDVFFDYQCPSCKRVETVYGPELEKLAKAGEIVLNNRPMTFLDKAHKNNSSSMTSIAATCADVVGVYTPFHNAIFAAQPASQSDEYPIALLRDQIPAKVGLSGEKLAQYQQCFDQKQTQDFVNGVDEKAYKAGVTGTPTIHVNGKNLDNKQFPQDPTKIGDIIKALAG